MVSIDPNKPLPPHTKLSYDECYAKVVLEEFFPEVFSGLLIADRPDLRCISGNHGIEVTSALPKDEQEALRIASCLPYRTVEQKARDIDYLARKGYKYTEYGMTHPPRHTWWFGFGYPPLEQTECKYVLQVFDNKVKKLNSGKYEKLTRYDLFIYSELLITDWMADKLLTELISRSTGESNYTNVYLLSLDGLYIFDLGKKCIEKVETGKRLWGLSEKARNMVEEGEEP